MQKSVGSGSAEERDAEEQVNKEENTILGIELEEKRMVKEAK